MKKYKYVIFDFNGTIIDDVDLCLDLLNKMLKAHNHPSVSLQRYKDIFTFPIKKYYELAGFDFSKESFEKLAIDFIKEYQPKSLGCNLYPKAVETFAYLKEKGYRLVVLSASQKNNLLEQMNHFSITEYFTEILGLDNIHATSKIEIAKRYFKDNKINPDEVLLVGDTLHDKEVADTLLVDCLLVECGHQSRSVLETSGNLVIEGIKDLMRIL